MRLKGSKVKGIATRLEGQTFRVLVIDGVIFVIRDRDRGLPLTLVRSDKHGVSLMY